MAQTFARLHRLNVIATVLHLVQGVVILLISNDFALPVTTFFWNDAPNNRLDVARLERSFDVSVAWAGALFLFLSALFHFIVASVGRQAYEGEIAAEQNRFRWVEYSISSTLMIITICLVFGIGDIAGLLGIAGANVAMILFGWVMEVVNRPGKPVWWTPFWFGCIVGIVPWIGLVIYLFGPGSEMPKFVYGIFVSIFIFFNLFALNQFLQYRKVGKWADYVYGEKVYLWLSLVAKSALAWQLYGNTLSA
ncbi:MAG: heliorhodopsin HeR [Acidobacteria bacterium]|nr:heliorhodopsin HeR [Acidobacteriota bacterium]